MSNATITLQARRNGSTNTFLVHFYGDADAARENALTFFDARSATHEITEAEDFGISSEFAELLERLYPESERCAHGMSRDLCEGPQHWGGYWEEREADYYESGIF